MLYSILSFSMILSESELEFQDHGIFRNEMSRKQCVVGIVTVKRGEIDHRGNFDQT